MSLGRWGARRERPQTTRGRRSDSRPAGSRSPSDPGRRNSRTRKAIDTGSLHATRPSSRGCPRSWAMTSIPLDRTATCAFRPARTIRRWRCTRSAISAASRSVVRGCDVPAGVRAHIAHHDHAVDTAQPLRVQGRHGQHPRHRPGRTRRERVGGGIRQSCVDGRRLVPRGPPDRDADRNVGSRAPQRAGVDHRPL